MRPIFQVLAESPGTKAEPSAADVQAQYEAARAEWQAEVDRAAALQAAYARQADKSSPAALAYLDETNRAQANAKFKLEPRRDRLKRQADEVKKRKPVDITTLIADRLLSIRITDKAGVDSDELEIVLDDRDGAVDLPRRGAMLEVSLGYKETGLTRIGRYKIDEVGSSGPPQQVFVRGKPADMAGGIKTARKHAWENTTLERVVKDLAARNKLTAVCKVKASIARLDQMNESDLNFITRVARQYDATAAIKGGKLLVLPRGGQAVSASGKKLPTLVIARRDIRRWSYTASDRDSAGAVKVKAHNKKTGKTESIVVPDKDNPNAPARVIRHSAPTKGQAAATAKASLDRGNRSTIQLSVEMAGRADIVAERTVNVSRIKAGVDGTYPVEAVTHDFGAGGWTTSLELGASKSALKKAGERKSKAKSKKAKKGPGAVITA